ncbi:hypothetical protein V8I69_003932 [Salmonella enterica]
MALEQRLRMAELQGAVDELHKAHDEKRKAVAEDLKLVLLNDIKDFFISKGFNIRETRTGLTGAFHGLELTVDVQNDGLDYFAQDFYMTVRLDKTELVLAVQLLTERPPDFMGKPDDIDGKIIFYEQTLIPALYERGVSDISAEKYAIKAAYSHDKVNRRRFDNVADVFNAML